MEKEFYTCPKCGVKLAVPAGKGRLRITCPKCGCVFFMENPAPETPVQSAPPKEKKKSRGKVLVILVAALTAIGWWQNRKAAQERDRGPADRTAITDSSATDTPSPPVDLIPEGACVVTYPCFDDYTGGDGTIDYEGYSQAERRFFRDEFGPAVRNFEEDIYILNMDGIMYLKQVDESMGDYFWINDRERKYSYLGKDAQGRDVTRAIFTYDCAKTELPAMERQLAEAAAQYKALVPPNADAWTTGLILHDALVRNITYDHSKTGQHIYDIYGALVEGSAVCNGYAEAFAYLMKDFGFNCDRVISENHAWNRVNEIPAYDNFIDPTWDDPDVADSNGRPYVFHGFFGLTREEVVAIDAHAIISASGSAFTDYLDPNYEVVGSYHKRMGYYLRTYDTAAIQSIFRQQLNKGENVLTVKFESQEDYQRAVSAQEDGSFGQLLVNMGYRGSYMYWHWDYLRTIDIGLNP